MKLLIRKLKPFFAPIFLILFCCLFLFLLQQLETNEFNISVDETKEFSDSIEPYCKDLSYFDALSYDILNINIKVANSNISYTEST